MGLTLNGLFREVVNLELEYCDNGILWAIVWDPNKVINIGEWVMCGGGWLERFYCMLYILCIIIHSI